MAVDEALLESAGRRGQPCLRFYQWSEPSLSLGYFQRVTDRGQHAASAHARLVRRATGGGAIVHHWELTYSYTVPARSRSQVETQRYYRVFHEAARRLLRERGVPAKLHPDPGPTTGDEPFLCFFRRTAGDLVAGGHKLLGSAQRRSRDALLQHGSLLLKASALAPELPGALELGATLPDVRELAETWQRHVAHLLDVRFFSHGLTDEETDRAKFWAAAKFDDPTWTLRR
jgi:lipoate-protein ligase A